MKYSLSRFALVLVFAASVLQACSDPASVETGGGGKLVGGGASVIDLGTVPIGTTKDTLIRISNTGSQLLVVTASQSNPQLTTALRLSDSIASADYRDVKFSITPSDTGLHQFRDTITYQTAGRTESSVLVFQARGVQIHPGANSAFTFATDIDGSYVGDSTYIFVETGLNIGGKTDVTKIVKNTDTTYLHYEASGDVSRYINFNVAFLGIDSSLWITLPIGSHKNSKAVLMSQNIQGAQVTVSDTTKYLGSEVVTAADQTFSTQKASVVIEVTVEAPLVGTLQTFESKSTFWYSPSIFYFVKSISEIQASGQVFNQSTVQTELLKAFILR